MNEAYFLNTEKAAACVTEREPMQPSPGFIKTLRGMQEAGMVGAADSARQLYPQWFENLSGSDADEIADIFAALSPLRLIEQEHGFGAALDLDHPYVRKLAEWDQLGPERRRNSLTYQEHVRSR